MSGQPKKRHARLPSIGDERSASPAPNCQGRSAFSSSRLYCLNIQIEPNQPFHAKLPRWKQAKITSRPLKNGDKCVHGSRPRPIRRLRSQTTSVRRIEYESPPRPAAFPSAHSRSACPLKERGRGRRDDWPFFYSSRFCTKRGTDPLPQGRASFRATTGLGSVPLFVQIAFESRPYAGNRKSKIAWPCGSRVPQRFGQEPH